MCGEDQTPPCNPPPPYDEGMVVELLHTLHLHCDVDHLFLVSKDLLVSPHRGLLEMNGVLNLQYGVYLHLQSGKILQDTKEVPCLLWQRLTFKVNEQIIFKFSKLFRVCLYIS